MNRWKCARCGRGLAQEPVMVAGMALGPTCARIVSGAAAAIRRPTRAERQEARRAAEFDAAQLNIFDTIPTA